MLDKGKDPRAAEVSDIVEAAEKDLPEMRKHKHD